MADRNGLRLIGWAYGGLTAVVALIAVVVVTAHINVPASARADSIAQYGISQ